MSEAGFNIDETTDFGARAARHLRVDPVVWLTTVTPSGAPSPNPVWFLWDGADTVRTWNLPTAARLAHIAANQRVTLNFDGDGNGGDIVVLSGVAQVDDAQPSADAVPEYLAKYAGHMARLGYTADGFGERYSAPITVRLTRLRGH